jgi:hypothetical protein
MTLAWTMSIGIAEGWLGVGRHKTVGLKVETSRGRLPISATLTSHAIFLFCKRTMKQDKRHSSLSCACKRPTMTIMSVVALLTTLHQSLTQAAEAASTDQLQPQGSCLANPSLNAEFEVINGGPIPLPDSCCMFDVCGLTCPQETSPPDHGTFAVSLTSR